MTFERLNQTRFKRKSSFIADQILSMINSGRYKIGTKLPPERLITEQMGVSRPSLREAISALQIIGILESRPGDGTYVTAPAATEELVRQTVTVLEEHDSPFENMQARKAMEIGAAQLAIKTATVADLNALKEAWKRKYELGRQGKYDEYTRYGKEFHLAIARATKNRIIETIMEKLLDVNIQPLWINMRLEYFRRDPDRINLMLEVHNRIMQAILERNTEQAIRALENHFDLLIEQIYGRNEENNDHQQVQRRSRISEEKRG